MKLIVALLVTFAVACSVSFFKLNINQQKTDFLIFKGRIQQETDPRSAKTWKAMHAGAFDSHE